jgi:glycosyltransferase involved in cell wall biosynthesis
VINLGMLSPPLARWPFVQQLRHTGQLIAALTALPVKPDVLHALWIGGTGLMTSLAGRLLRIPTVLTVWAGELVWLPQICYGGQGRWRQRQQLDLALRWATTVTVGSRYVERQLPAWRHPAHWLPLGVDATRFAAPVGRSAGPPWRLLHVASINQVKDPYTLLQTMKLVNEQAPGVHLDWIGEDTLQGKIQRHALALGLGNVITFHGFQPTDRVSALAWQAHLYVQSSLHEGQGVSVLEAAAAGVPTVGSAVGLVAELAPHAALAVPVADPQALAGGILRLLANPAEREAFGQAAQHWANIYDADWTATACETLYARLRGIAASR